MTKEQTETVVETNEPNAGEAASADDKRERSTIDFPYNDLDDAVKVAKAIHGNAGVSCTLDQLAAYIGQSMTSGAFRLRVSNASTFGLTTNERGTVTLTDIGRRVADETQEPSARVDAFLHVALYARIYENYKGYTLPPPGALEKFMREVGVAAKQTGKARQAFMRSARQAGFFIHGEDRLVRPAGPGTKPAAEPPKPTLEDNTEKKKKNGGSGGSGGDELHPFIQGLLKTLPTPETEDGGKTKWPSDQRVKWLQTAANIFDLIYEGEGGIEVRSAFATRSPRPGE